MQPLADRFRPQSIDDMVGQSHIIGKGKILNKLIQNKTIPNMILYGPPGTGKTTLANIIANATGKKYIKLNAVNCGVKEIKEVIEATKRDLFSYNGIILMLDEIQALNKKQQQSLLEVIEEGSVTLIASTADNPYFAIYKAILSRCSVFEFKQINSQDIFIGLMNSIEKLRNLYKSKTIKVEEKAIRYIAETCNGDMRSALNKLELVFNVSIDSNSDEINITLDNTIECSSVKILNYDNKGDDSYSILSAFHKSIRGSDIDASIHYLARLIKAGDLNSITRRLLCIACEDVGLAVPQAITIVEACVNAANQLGFPEAQLPLAQATIYLANCPKSNSTYAAIQSAIYDLDNIEVGDIPVHLKDAHYSGAKNLGRGIDYKYPHNYENNYVSQQYMPELIKDKKYYNPGKNKNEMAFKAYWENLKNKG
ncbi:MULTISPECIES: replication-associated recombination protein A [Romboutsia]|uniref:Replication-associated recombination protein A n=1 Tax=Romboutsia hominis TaxID=1507512 RepID=A0A2P2BTC9_9FIRM|nr:MULTISPECIES: replication-associated recombination protein A [Romboutsia]MCH1960900.1 replication-associated recombination protein A [Romboutsia hominis]MCH1968666.1 replication-associated recombination protein A [Romboutsia hominis]MDB8789679.1 replication-associated recombination protein A [Romboutsia sp. 1001216sp1]MDB8792981.1 replication-associated recombination protein A [Romboutsia sp. 1001216sp1]MDB8795216.1 replication-associated recombination protein A [Romboutsia sp. 1001216sp1]